MVRRQYSRFFQLEPGWPIWIRDARSPKWHEPCFNRSIGLSADWPKNGRTQIVDLSTIAANQTFQGRVVPGRWPRERFRG